MRRRCSFVFAIGSNHPTTVAQQQHLLRAHPSVAHATVLDADAIERALALGLDLLVSLPPDATDASVARFADTIVGGPAAGGRTPPVAGLVMSGGDTAARLCQHLRATRIDLGGEVRPGIPWGTLTVQSGRRWPVVLKSGGFGADDALACTLAFLMENDERHG